jgi:hypothetical protein
MAMTKIEFSHCLYVLSFSGSIFLKKKVHSLPPFFNIMPLIILGRKGIVSFLKEGFYPFKISSFYNK